MKKVKFTRERFDARVRSRDVLIIDNLIENHMLFEIRINGYLFDFIYILPNGCKLYELKNIPKNVQIKIKEVIQDVDLTLPENCYYRDYTFFENIENIYFGRN